MLSHFTILFVDDKPDCIGPIIIELRARFAALMPNLTFEFLRAATLAEGLALSPQANATVLDGELPDSPISNTIASIPRFAPPVILLTGHARSDYMAQAILQGAADVFEKGTTADLPLQILECLLRDFKARYV